MFEMIKELVYLSLHYIYFGITKIYTIIFGTIEESYDIDDVSPFDKPKEYQPSKVYEINVINVQEKRRYICYLPPQFGDNIKLIAILDNRERGITHIFERHKEQFDEPSKICKTHNDLISSLKQNLKDFNYIGREYDLRGQKHLWKTKDFWGYSRELVTILKPHKDYFELITAYKNSTESSF